MNEQEKQCIIGVFRGRSFIDGELSGKNMSDWGL
jgi:hypothetical protein